MREHYTRIICSVTNTSIVDKPENFYRLPKTESKNGDQVAVLGHDN